LISKISQAKSKNVNRSVVKSSAKIKNNGKIEKEQDKVGKRNV